MGSKCIETVPAAKLAYGVVASVWTIVGLISVVFVRPRPIVLEGLSTSWAKGENHDAAGWLRQLHNVKRRKLSLEFGKIDLVVVERQWF